MRLDFTEVLQKWGKLQERDLARARGVAEATGEALHLVLPKLGFVAEEVVTDAVSESLGIAAVGENDYPPSAILADRLSVEFLLASRVLPIADEGGSVVVAMANPFDEEAVRALSLKLGKSVTRRIATPFQLERQFTRLLRVQGGRGASAEVADGINAADVERLRDMASEAPIVRTVNRLIEDAIGVNASDIHVEPADGELQVRYRVDGLLRRVDAPQAVLAPALVSRIKIMAGLDIVERRRSQDGSCRFSVQGRSIDIRVSVIPTIHGEGLVLRLLDKATAPLDLKRLGMADDTHAALTRIVNSRSGIFLATGPTGGGKTTTLYAALQRLNTDERKLITVEDPIEYRLSGINQIQVNAKIGMGFPDMLRSVLRHDPDVIMVGEVRDLETARIAIQAALTGHVVLSTLHTNDSCGALTRLIDMGVEPFLVTSTVNGVMAQRLVRTLCPQCKRPSNRQDEAKRFAEHLGVAWGTATAYEGAGCKACGGTGYSGRTAIFELLDMGEDLRAAVLERIDLGTLQKIAINAGLRTLRHDGLAKVMAGRTTVEEVLRVTQEH